MGKEEILNKLCDFAGHYLKEDVEIAMSQYADQEKEKVAVAFSNWRNEYVNELTHEFLIYTKGSEDTVVVNDASSLYQYFITNVYNK